MEQVSRFSHSDFPALRASQCLLEGRRNWIDAEQASNLDSIQFRTDACKFWRCLCGLNIRLKNMSGVDDIINYKKKVEEDYYAILGCSDDSTVSIFRIQKMIT